MAVFPIIAMGVGMAISAYGQHKAGQSAKKAALKGKQASDAAAQLDDFNAQIAEAQADDAVAIGAEDEAKYRTMVKGIVGTQRAGFAATNVDVSFGSSLDVIADTAYQGEIDAMTIRQNAQRQAWGYRVAAADYRKRGFIRRMEGRSIAAGGFEQASQANFGAFSTLAQGSLSLVGSLARKYNWRMPGRNSANANSALGGA